MGIYLKADCISTALFQSSDCSKCCTTCVALCRSYTNGRVRHARRQPARQLLSNLGYLSVSCLRILLHAARESNHQPSDDWLTHSTSLATAARMSIVSESETVVYIKGLQWGPHCIRSLKSNGLHIIWQPAFKSHLNMTFWWNPC